MENYTEKHSLIDYMMILHRHKQHCGPGHHSQSMTFGVNNNDKPKNISKNTDGFPAIGHQLLLIKFGEKFRMSENLRKNI